MSIPRGNAAFVYLFVAFLLTWGSIIGAWRLWAAKPTRASTFQSYAGFAIEAGPLLLSIICIVAVPVIRMGVTHAPVYDPIGVGSDVGTPPCETHEIAQRANANGVVAS